MITKSELIDIWVQNTKKSNKKYSALFNENGFMRFVQGTFMSDSEREDYINRLREVGCGSICVYSGCSLNRSYASDEWTEELWMGILKMYIKDRLKFRVDYHRESVINGIVCLLELDIPHVPVCDVPVGYRKFYSDDDFGYYGFPHIIDIASFIGLNISDELSRFTGFCREEDVPKFDMMKWQEVFSDSKQITTLSKSVSDGRVIDLDELPRYSFGSFEHFEIEKKYYTYAEDIAVIHHIIGKYIDLRKVNDGEKYIYSLIDEYGWLVGFYEGSSIYKISTVQGYSFYVYRGNAYIDDIGIKKIKFGHSKPDDLSLGDERVFIVYNRKTGYWVLPKLRYPVKFKRFVLDTLKKNMDKIGKWCDTIVFAHSGTLNGDSYGFDVDDYPDVRSVDEFVEKVVNSVIQKSIGKLSLPDSLSSLGIKIKVEMENQLEFDKVMKPLDCICQDDIDKYVESHCQTMYEIERYKK